MSGIYEEKQANGDALAVMRLGGSDRAVAACRDLPLILQHRTAPALETDIVSTWRDYPGQDAKVPSGVTMEVRRDNGTIVQTIRGRVPDGEPLDISYDLGGDKTGLPRLRTNLQLDRRGEGEQPRSRLRLRTETARRIVPVKSGDAEITVMSETGRVFAWPEDGRFLSQRIAQVVLTLQSGSREDFAAFAEALAGETGLLPADRSPEEIGRALLREDIGGPVKAPRYDLAPDVSALEVLEKSLDAAATQMLGNIPYVRMGDADAIKQMRIGLRRFRSIERIFRPHLPAERMAQLVSEAKRAGEILGYCRDLDVFLGETLPGLMQSGLQQQEEAVALEAIARKAEALRQQDRRNAIALADGDTRFAGFCVALRALLAEAPWRNEEELAAAARHYAVPVLDRVRRKVRKTGKTLAGAPAPERHPLRIELKKLRYAIQAFRPLYEKDVRKPYMSAMSTLQDEFGTLNDAVVAREIVLRIARADVGNEDAFEIEAGAGYVIGWTQRGLSGQADSVMDAWQAFEDVEPFWREAE